ncbi:biotin--[acetyl-CoA-carboxylase] ligase [Niveibacterium sp. 24ML]|uniref:biotin--[acetyl-CoA-carboxylase] ligase n=1 Tax=Niveibacterium sp. 24ML TaxID=2985512 RepID=UPI00226EA089|nr:biotin--[acetyl-CoA-carboxylase] ligase [Niveibacterium sp. 24ML]MCX9154783.1 biotin--[acetyl-CoA-carboxylase] ligase [Niveibacterium sp. 24ML]
MSDAIDQQLARLKSQLGPLAARFDADLLETCTSTSAVLSERALAGAPSGSVLWAIEQTAGRGRRGRVWVARPGASLTFSLLWRFAPGVRLSGLSLAVGLAVACALERLGARGLALKWPNDIWLNGRKLGGILIELQQSGGRTAALIGIGLNIKAPQAGDVIDQPVAGLDESGVTTCDAGGVLAAVLAELATVLDGFAAAGFAPFRDQWQARHALQDEAVRLIDDTGEAEGICRGVDAEGALMLERNGTLVRVLGGDVSLRRPA